MALKIALTILLSAIIGYVTNYLAIKMLFHPLTEHYLFKKIKIPFTPGIIPKNRYRMSTSIAEMISKSALNDDVIAEEITKKIDVEQLFSSNLDKSLNEIFSSDNLESNKKNLSKLFTSHLINRFIEGNYAAVIANSFFDSISKNLGFLQAVLGNLNELIEKKIKDFILSNEDKLNCIIEDEINFIMDKDLNSLINDNKNFTCFSEIITSFIKNAISNLNFKEIIENEINNLDIKSFEKMILNVLSKELRAITYLGAFLGAILGTINVLFIYL